jgi:hydrogenase maturation protease
MLMAKRFKDWVPVRPVSMVKKAKTLILGMGNPILGDDSVGLRVAATLREIIGSPDINVITTELGGINLLELLVGYDNAIIVDAMKTAHGKPGKISVFNLESLDGTRHTGSTHNFDLSTTIELGKQLGLDLPRNITIFAVEIAAIDTFSEECSPDVEQAIPQCIDKILQYIQI